MNSIFVSIENLFFDPNNYRLRSNPKYLPVDPQPSTVVREAIQKRTLSLISGKGNYEIKDLVESFKSNGLLKVDNILVKKLGSTQYLVIEGNRRLAALKILKEEYENGFPIGELNPNVFEKSKTMKDGQGIEVVLYHYKNENDYLVLMGLRHVSGNKKWDRYNQAKLIYELQDGGYDLLSIANRIGLASKAQAQKYLNAYFAIEEFVQESENYDYGDDFNPHDKFMIFLEVLGQKKLREWLQWDDHVKSFKNNENKKRFFDWITPQTEYDEEEDKEIVSSPLIVSHKEVRELDEIIDDEESLELMEKTKDFRGTLEQNEAFTQKKFAKELTKAESILKNIKFGPSLKLSTDDQVALKNIIKISKLILESSEAED